MRLPNVGNAKIPENKFTASTAAIEKFRQQFAVKTKTTVVVTTRMK
jgi:hypothetical protein